MDSKFTIEVHCYIFKTIWGIGKSIKVACISCGMSRVESLNLPNKCLILGSHHGVNIYSKGPLSIDFMEKQRCFLPHQDSNPL